MTISTPLPTALHVNRRAAAEVADGAVDLAAGSAAEAAAQPLACPACGGWVSVPCPEPELAHLARCPGCGLMAVRALPAAEVLAEVYTAEYYKSSASHVVGYEDYAADRDNIALTAARRLRQLERFAPERGRLLDVGCALGYFMDVARRGGWEVSGLDVSAHAVAEARRLTGRPVHLGDLAGAPVEPGSQDVITMWDVIEHVPDPLAHLAACRRLLAEGGLIALTTPDLGSLTARLYGPRWMGFKLADEHLYYFSRATLRAMLEASGFRVVHMGYYGKDVTLAFFVRRLGLYAPRLARLLAPAVARSGLGARALYVNPRDIVGVIAAKA
jgi:2-polyprenyl-3-methyl-5-hydroxy-6-metoxy-1,4-benzoquinol methylase